MADAADEEFDKVLELAGNDGKFQKRYNWLFNFFFVLCAGMTYMNLLAVLEEPDHVCRVPGRERFNVSQEEWKNITLPREIDNKGEESFSTCKMYNITSVLLDNTTIFETWNFTKSDITDCTNGYIYSKEWYASTPLSDGDWVCEKSSYAANILSANRVGEVIGTLIFGQLGDTWGRRPVFYMSLILQLLSRTWTLLASSSFTQFVISTTVGVMIANSIFMCPLVICMEICKAEDRAKMAFLQYIGWTLGMSIMPLVFWWVREWKTFMILTTLPCILPFIFHKYLVESPRWLATKGKYKECATQLQIIAKINEKDINITEKMLRGTLKIAEVEKVYGIASLFTNFNLAKNTIVITSCWTLCSGAYYSLLILSTKIGGNPFLNFSWQATAEIPAYFLGRYLADKYGRRFTNIFSFSISILACFSLIFTVRHTDSYLTMLLAVCAKFIGSINFYVLSLVQMELFPTCLRQSGISMGNITANLIGILSPQIVNLGMNHDIRYPFMIITAMYIAGMFLALYIPETLHQKLPNSLKEAKTFGLGQKFWSLPKKTNTEESENIEVTQKLQPENNLP